MTMDAAIRSQNESALTSNTTSPYNPTAQQGRLRAQRLNAYLSEEGHEGNHLVALHEDGQGNDTEGYCNLGISITAFEDEFISGNIGVMHTSKRTVRYDVVQPELSQQQDLDTMKAGAWTQHAYTGLWPNQIDSADSLYLANGPAINHTQPELQQHGTGPAGSTKASRPRGPSAARANRSCAAGDSSHRAQKRNYAAEGSSSRP